MILGIGIDQIEVARVARNVELPEFLAKVYSSAEIKYCQARGIPKQHFAARFAAKEAMLKALGTGLHGGFRLSEIAVLPDETGRPVMHLEGKVKAHLAKLGVSNIQVSLSHLKDIACAIVILEK